VHSFGRVNPRGVSGDTPSPELGESFERARTQLELERPVTVISAPAGYGKTSVARALAASRDHATAWVAVDPGDSHARFWRKMAEAWEALGSEPLADELTPDVLLAAAGDLTDPALLVLDDLHHMHDPVVFGELVWLVDRLPDPLHLLVTTRRHLPWPLARWRTRDQVAEVEADDLRLTVDQACLLPGLAGRPLEHARRLAQRAEGWPLGLEVLATATRPDDPLGDVLARLDPDLRGRIDLPALVAASFTQAAPEVEEFLLATSVLDSFDADLCAAVTERPDAGALLHQVEAGNLFLVPLDNRRTWFRYEQLFGEILRFELERRGHAETVALHERAAAWYQQRGDLSRAVEHLVAAGDVERAFWLTSENIGLSWTTPGADEVSRAIAVFSLDWLAGDPARIVSFSTMLNRSGDPALVTRWLAAADAAYALVVDEQTDDDPRRALLESARAISSAAYGHVAVVVAAAEKAALPLAAHPDLAPLQGAVWMVTVNGYLALDTDEAVDAAEELCVALDGSGSSEFVHGVAVPGFRARIALRRGDLTFAHELGQQSLRMAETLGMSEHALVRNPLVALAGVRLERGEIADVEAMVETARDLVAVRGWPGMAAQMQVELARVRAVLHGPTAGLLVVEEAWRDLDGHPVGPELAASLDATAARLHIDASDLDAAADLVAGLPAGEVRHQLELRLALARHDTHTASDLAAASPRPHNRRDAIVSALLAARLAALRERHAERDRHLLAAANAAVDAGFCQIIRVEAPELVPVLRRLGPSGSPVAGLCAALDRLPPGPAVVRRADELTHRELAVLRRLVSPLTNQEIAGEMAVSTNTVKTHIRTLYRKLGVGSRADAVAVARRRGLL
jgi:LuxR family transcriptional regulator, maltose regulon positive regulatory protein